MLQQSGRNLHLRFYAFVDIGITYGMRHVVRFGSKGDIYFQSQADDKLIAHFALLLAYAVVGKEADVIKEYVTVHNLLHKMPSCAAKISKSTYICKPWTEVQVNNFLFSKMFHHKHLCII